MKIQLLYRWDKQIFFRPPLHLYPVFSFSKIKVVMHILLVSLFLSICLSRSFDVSKFLIQMKLAVTNWKVLNWKISKLAMHINKFFASQNPFSKIFTIKQKRKKNKKKQLLICERFDCVRFNRNSFGKKFNLEQTALLKFCSFSFFFFFCFVFVLHPRANFARNQLCGIRFLIEKKQTNKKKKFNRIEIILLNIPFLNSFDFHKCQQSCIKSGGPR